MAGAARPQAPWPPGISRGARLARAIAQYPREIWPRVVYSRVLVEEGRDAVVTERALRDVLAMDPNHAESRESLETLLMKS